MKMLNLNARMRVLLEKKQNMTNGFGRLLEFDVKSLISDSESLFLHTKNDLFKITLIKTYCLFLVDKTMLFFSYHSGGILR